VAIGGFANPKMLQKAWLKGTTDKAPIYYNPGETMVFTIEPQGIKGELPAGKYFLKWERTGDDGIKEEGKEPFTGTKPFVYKTSIAKPGFVRLYAVVVDEKDQPFKKKKPTFKGDPNSPEGRAAYRRFKKIRRHIIFDGGAAADIDTLQQGAPEPKDFDAFWAKQKEALAKVAFNAKRIEVKSGNPNARLYALSVDCTGGMPVTGYLSIPKDAENGKKFPIKIGAFGYGVGEQHPPRDPSDDAIEFKMNAHGFLLREFGGTDEYYRTYGDRIKSNGYTYAFDPKQNSNTETSYMRGMILRMIRAIQYTKSLPEWNGKDISVSGNSQGGAFAIWAAGCGEGVTLAESSITWCCDMSMNEKRLARKVASDGWYIPWTPSMGYYDAVNFAKRIPASCRTVIPRAGLGDYCCPPTGLMKLWNNIPGNNKKITWVQGSKHGYVPPA
jgi:cephalosporin-C deacetylase-like acetyl esterase